MIKVKEGIAYSVLDVADDPEAGIRVGPPAFESVDWAALLYESAAVHNCLTEQDAFAEDRLGRVVRDVKTKLQALYKGQVAEEVKE